MYPTLALLLLISIAWPSSLMVVSAVPQLPVMMGDELTASEIGEIEQILSRSNPKYATNITAIQEALGKLILAEIVDPENQENLPSPAEVLVLSRKLQKIGQLLSASLSNGDYQRRDKQLMEQLQRLEEGTVANDRSGNAANPTCPLASALVLSIVFLVLPFSVRI